MDYGPDRLDAEIMETLQELGPTTLSELARTLGLSKGALWKRIRRLAGAGLLSARRVGGALIVEANAPKSPPPIVRIGILRASEYPYILGLARRLRDLFYDVSIHVYDEARRLAMDLAAGRVHLAMAPLTTLVLAHRVSGGIVHIIGGGSGGGAFIAWNPTGGRGHATTMSSSMELCAELRGLPGPRVYASSGDEILALLKSGRVRAAALWEPYASRASRLGFEVEDCGLPVCCVLGAHRSLEPLYARIARAMEESVSDARRGAWDPGAYSRLTGIPAPEVEKTVKHYRLLEEPPRDEAKRLWDFLARAALPKTAIEYLIP
ncbi:MAG: AsnC family transcriptional regulator [Desulfurococcales archaeon]|nr:AsnC family transcriptional regulator [Desulfurococcales archaeon]